jgi:hypothetical protein
MSTPSGPGKVEALDLDMNGHFITYTYILVYNSIYEYIHQNTTRSQFPKPDENVA